MKRLILKILHVLQSWLLLRSTFKAYSKGNYFSGSFIHGDSPGKNTRVGCHALLQGIFPTQGLNPGLPHCKQILYHLSHQGSPRILEWVAYPFSRGSSQPGNRTSISCIAGKFFTSWTTGKTHNWNHDHSNPKTDLLQANVKSIWLKNSPFSTSIYAYKHGLRIYKLSPWEKSHFIVGKYFQDIEQ